MPIIFAKQFSSQPWKNGGGTTHEILRDAEGPDFGFRLSVADVGSNGPFSTFPLHQRILTVIAGAGMDLHHARGTLAAAPMEPLVFSGALPLQGVLRAGPCRDFNVIFDPSRFDAVVQRVNEVPDFTTVILDGLLITAGHVRVMGEAAAAGDFVVFAPGVKVESVTAFEALHVCIKAGPANV